jgi:trimethylamine:corrinoid methyltransferase-like protein
MPSEASSEACISPIAIKPEMRINTMADEDVAKINQATLAVLEQTGVKFRSEKALHILADAGADTETIALHELEAAFSSTEKHVHIVSCADRNCAQFAVEMAGVIAGSKE